MDAKLPRDARILLVGQAAVFHLEHPVVYNTVFNRGDDRGLSRDRDPAAFRRALHELELTHIYVDWHEIERYRQPGNYGFTDLRDARAVRGLGRGRRTGTADLPVGTDQDLYRIR